MTDAISVVVADDEADVRLLRRLQLESRGFVVAGEARDGRSAIKVQKETGADIVLMDLLMPGVSGIQAIAELRTEKPDLKVVAYTAVAGDFVRNEMARLGVPLVLKSGDVEPLAQLLRDVMSSNA